MKTQLVEKRTTEFSAGGTDRFPSAHVGSRTVLLISNDKRFYESLRSLANKLGLIVVKAECTRGTLAVLRATRPVAVLLDLDSPGGAAWGTADILLNEPGCPAVILLTGRSGQFDLQTAIRAGSLVSKSETPHRLLEIIEKALEMPEDNQTERTAIQRVLIRWLRPLAWEEVTTPAYRFWRINE